MDAENVDEWLKKNRVRVFEDKWLCIIYKLYYDEAYKRVIYRRAHIEIPDAFVCKNVVVK